MKIMNTLNSESRWPFQNLFRFIPYAIWRRMFATPQKFLKQGNAALQKLYLNYFTF